MSKLFTGTFKAVAVDPQIGEAKGGRFKARIEFEISEGKDTEGVSRVGQRVAYDGKLDGDNIKFTKNAMQKVGWAGKDVRTFRADVLAAKKVVDIECEVASFKRDDGSLSEWTTVRKIGGAPPLAPIAADKLADVNQWFADAPALEPQDGGAPAGAETDIPF